MSASVESERSGLLYLYSAVLLLSLTGLFSKVIPLDATTITQHRSLIAAVIFVGIFCIQGKAIFLSGRKQLFGVYALGVIMGIHWITYFHAMQVSTVAIGMLSLFSYPVITVLIEPFFNHKRPQWIDVLSATVVFVGVIVMVSEELFFSENPSETSGFLLGAAWGVFSAVCFSVRNTVQKYYFAQVPSSSLMFHQVLLITIMLLPYADFQASYDAIVDSPGFFVLILLVLLALLPTVIGHTMLSLSLKKLPAKSVAIISCMQPVFGAFFAWQFLDERPSVYVMVGGAIILSVAVNEAVNSVTNR